MHIVDSHTAGEPTRVVISGGPDLGAGPLAERLAVFRERFDRYRSAVVNEPRGSDVLVGALLCEPCDPTCAAGVIFFNNVGYLGMCGHGAIGVATTLRWLNRIEPGRHRLEMPVGTVGIELHGDGRVSIQNVPSRREASRVTVEVPGHGRVLGDVAWSGNWFYLVGDHGEDLQLSRVAHLTDFTTRIRQAVNAAFPAVDHIELFGPPASSAAHSRNFVLCPGGAYDRSPCGTGTSAKLACLAADGKLAPGEPWVQESILGTKFVGSYAWHGEAKRTIIPTITGTAWVNAESHLVFDERDPFGWGIGQPG